MGIRAEGAKAAPETVGEGYPLYAIAAADVVRTKALSAAKLVAWRYAVLRAGEAAGVLEMRRAGKRLAFAKLHEGERGALAERAIGAVRAHAELQQRALSPRFLRIPSLNLLAAWGHGKEAREDVLVPVPPAPPPFRAFEPMSAERFVAAVLELRPPAPRGGRAATGGAGDPTLPARGRPRPRTRRRRGK